MGKKGIVILIVFVLIGGLVAWFIIDGRYRVEGGRAPWAVINDEPEVLAQALKEGIGAEEKQDAMRRAVSRENFKAMNMLLEAGASVDPPSGCYVEGPIRWGRIKVARLLLEKGADPKRCKTDLSAMMVHTVVYGAKESPQADIIAVLSRLAAAGGQAQAKTKSHGSALEAARKRKLDKVVAYLQNPGAQPVPAAAPPGGEAPRGKPGSVDMDDLKTVCEGKALPGAAPYVKQAGNASKLLYFERRYEKWRWPGRGPGMPELPAWWTDFKEKSNTQLVACVDLTDKTKVHNCKYRGSGGGINAYAATVTITLYEAKTGRKVDSMSVKKGAPRCPSIKMGKKQEGLFPAYSKELEDFCAPHVGGPQ